MFDAKRSASEILSRLQDAVGEIANDMLSPTSGFLTDEWAKKIKTAKRKGVRDVHGWLADTLYSDPEEVAGLIGDWICDESQNDKGNKESLLAELERVGGTTVKKACKKLRED